MTDKQVHVRMINKRFIIVGVFFLILAGLMIYYVVKTTPTVEQYNTDIASKAALESQISSLESANNQLRETINQTGNELVSFSEDKIRYIKLASEKSEECGVSINNLTVSDVWTEGTMTAMTTSIEVEGSLENLVKFINSYCSINYTNRINVISCRPEGRYPWLSRTIDGQKVLTWFDLTAEQNTYDQWVEQQEQEIQQAIQEAYPTSTYESSMYNVTTATSEQNDGLLEDSVENQDAYTETSSEGNSSNKTSSSGSSPNSSTTSSNITGTATNSSGTEIVDSSVEGVTTTVQIPTYTQPTVVTGSTSVESDKGITLAEMFSEKTFKIYLEIDFLGRQ